MNKKIFLIPYFKSYLSQSTTTSDPLTCGCHIPSTSFILLNEIWQHWAWLIVGVRLLAA